MTDLSHIIPHFPIQSYSHLLPSLEKNLITTADLLTFDALEIARRAQLPVLDLRRLSRAVVEALHNQLGISTSSETDESSTSPNGETLHTVDKVLKSGSSTISTLDGSLDATLGGGVPTGYLTEVTGESGAGKTQFLMHLLLSVQLPPPFGISKSALYISTEAPLPTQRLEQLLKHHPVLSDEAVDRPSSLSGILSINTPDLESQDHILQYQVPVAVRRHKIGLVIIDSITANYRAEFDPSGSRGPADLARRSGELARIGQFLRNLARTEDIAVVVANQVSDRFLNAPRRPHTSIFQDAPPSSSPTPAPRSTMPPPPIPQAPPSSAPASSASSVVEADIGVDALSLEHQQGFFGHIPSSGGAPKQPALGLVWSNQIAARIVLSKKLIYAHSSGLTSSMRDGIDESEDWAPVRTRRWLSVAFAPWVASSNEGDGTEFEILESGLKAVSNTEDEPL